MHITFTDHAVEQINSRFAPGDGELKLVFDSEGCGCAVSGVPVLWIVDQAADKELRAEGTPYRIVYEKRHEVYFEDRMVLDFEPKRGSFILKSDGQIYNAQMRLIDKRAQ
ncbi:iron-sulfur cluster biosynthesis family protein [Paenibacillus piri]|uniref:Core domain-containing protein n=1 Tax=Paenibacillus piri TaxID=2547395 RepID=A0A4R5KWI2_9BACL|nr:iron-sulfur cluster biosynthesis family protein [Paenibacillus piri]TDF99538.1 hypothetical protein E1757_06750 [Paenibacillus piri]